MVVGEDRHEDRRDAAGYEAPGVGLGDVHPGLVARPAEADLRVDH